MGKFVITVLLGFLVIFNIVANNINKTSTEAEVNLYDSYGKVMAKDIAESGAQAIISKLADDSSWRGEKANITFGGGVFTAGAVDDTSIGTGGIRVYSYSSFNAVQDSAVVHLTFTSSLPVGVRGALTTRGDVKMKSITIDGRDHDQFGNLIPSSGTFGISTTNTLFEQLELAEVGGTDESGTDFVPSLPANPGIYETEAVWAGGFPDTPDKIMGGAAAGYPEGTLKSIAQSGVNGSQYVTDWIDLTLPLRGVSYVEGTNSDINFGDFSSGILVVHNASGTALMDDFVGIFKGLIIADMLDWEIETIPCDIIGALVVLNDASDVQIEGMGSVKYSSEVLGNLSSELPAGGGSNLNIIGWIH